MRRWEWACLCPRLSWQILTDSKNWRQAAYEIAYFDGEGAPLAETGRIEADQSIFVPWPFAPLKARQRVSLSVRVWGEDGGESAWSDPLPVEMGLLDPDDWVAQFVSPAWSEDTSQVNPAPYLRREFNLRDSPISQARLYITALGVYEAEINGQRVGDQILAPGWTVYDKRLRYQTFDVTELLTPGANAIGAILADGWYRGRFGFMGGRRNIWGDRLALLAQLEVTYADGSSEQTITDDSWQAATGPIQMACIYDGERYDARLEQPGWSRPGFAAADWTAVEPFEQDLDVLIAPPGPPARCQETLAPVAISQSPAGKTLVDFGQNLVGWLRLRVQGERGQTITLRHAEVLENEELGTRPLRIAEATDTYTLKGDGVEVWEPRFTFHGFRYAEVSGWPGELKAEDIAAVVVHSDMERIGWFTCSDPLLNRLHDNVVWGMRGNFLDVPTDCPQRDERLGWTGDLQVFAATGAYIYDVGGFLASWLADLEADQMKGGGAVPLIVPNILGEGFGTAAWSDAAAVVPWVLYKRYGDLGILTEQYGSMCAWVDHVEGLASENGLWDRSFQLGDWLDPTAPPDNPGQARTAKAIVATAYFAHSAGIIAKAARLLGKTADERRYGALAGRVRAAFAKEYVTPAGRLMSDAETAYALAICFDLLTDPVQRQRAGDRLAELAMESGYHIRTGFVGTPLVCDALASTGHHKAAYRLLTQQECPSWLYPITMGATTIWERWDSMLPDGAINPGEMTSFNHYALGAVGDWMQRAIGGLAPAEPGYRRLEVRPRPGGGISSAETRHLTPYGPASCQWAIEEGQFKLELDAPPNCTATVYLPGADEPIEVGSGRWNWSVPYTDPDVRGPFTIDDLVGEIAYDPAARATVMRVLEEINAPGLLRGIIFNEPIVPMRQALRMVPDYANALVTMNDALAALCEEANA